MINSLKPSDFTSRRGYLVGVFSMQVIQTIDGKVNLADVPKPTNDEMQNEYNYLLAEQLTKKLLDAGLITDDEFTRIMARNRRSFSPFISKVIDK